MRKLYGFLADSYYEVTQNVTWTKTDKLHQSTMLVIVGTLVFSLVIGLIDSIYKVGLEAVYDLFK